MKDKHRFDNCLMVPMPRLGGGEGTPVSSESAAAYLSRVTATATAEHLTSVNVSEDARSKTNQVCRSDDHCFPS